MSIYPTRTAAHLAVAGVGVFVLGIVLREVVVVGWGGAILVAIALARAVTLVSVMRIRSAGFEMLWTGHERLVRAKPGGVVTLRAEVRNRDTLSARFDKLRVIASPALETWVEPLAGEVPATGSVKLDIHVRCLRVGYHGIFGLALEVRGAPGLFEVPLTFANPYGVEVAPRALARPLMLPHGGRSRSRAVAGRSGRQRGDGTDLHELREHLPGDSFRRIAWKASARRGKLVVKEFEREERDVVILVVDASVELWAGPMGQAPLDRILDLAATVAATHVAQGDLVGLRLLAARELAKVDPDGGRKQLSRIAQALMEHSGVLDADRSGWDPSEIASQVTEHLRPHDARAVGDLRGGRFDRLADRADNMRASAPFDRPAPLGRSGESSDARLRHYAAAFGLFVPSRLEPDRARTLTTLARVLGELGQKGKKGRASLVHVVAPTPDRVEGLAKSVRRLKARGVRVRWTVPPVDAHEGDREGSLDEVVERAVRLRARIASRRGEQALRRLGVKVVVAQRPAPVGPPAVEEPEQDVA